MMDNLIVAYYDRVVAGAGNDGMKLADAKAAVVEHVTELLATGGMDMPSVDAIAEALVDRDITPARKARRASLHRDIEHITDALSGDTILGRDDPGLWVAFPLGDGRDKTLALWSADDWVGSLRVRKDKEAELKAANAIYEEQVSLVVAAMFARDVATTAGLFPEHGTSAA